MHPTPSPHLTTARLLLASLVLIAGPLSAQAPTPAGSWKGTWDSPDGSVYTASAQLTVTPAGAVDGVINWTLKAATRADLIPKVGLSGVEYVRGTFDARCRVLTAAGYRLDDPQQILGMDRYELILTVNGAGLGGVTADNGAWTGMLSLRR